MRVSSTGSGLAQKIRLPQFALPAYIKIREVSRCCAWTHLLWRVLRPGRFYKGFKHLLFHLLVLLRETKVVRF